MVPTRLDPAMRAQVLAIASAAERQLGLAECQIAIVVHASESGVYELAIACDRHPELIRAMRRAFPRRTDGRLRATIGPFGDLNLVNVTAADVASATGRLG
ncbi:hypothetical protein H8M03_08200 [Sphingomonas sabuli]|uniref:Uncharacterized protein n=1 Tax=Sphingomonas sabuli TaxID=2764186 RepID=A0A7G9L065_9SPHN|nr:hypothetical protein [Sphingomonas sabuli]QNM82014.1 hypothetical protein H8M03_08200 [Sphingomonas sabuli]